MNIVKVPIAISDRKLRYTLGASSSASIFFLLISRHVILYLSNPTREGERELMDGPDDSLSRGRERGTRRSTTRHREDPVKVAPSGRASRISRDYVSVGSSGSRGWLKDIDTFLSLFLSLIRSLSLYLFLSPSETCTPLLEGEGNLCNPVMTA